VALSGTKVIYEPFALPVTKRQCQRTEGYMVLTWTRGLASFFLHPSPDT